MATITLQGNKIHTNGSLPAVGSAIPDFRLVDKDLNDTNLASFAGKKKLISIVPSLDTPVCQLSTKKLDAFAKQRADVVVLTVSADLPFAQSRFCQGEGLDNVVTLAMMRSRNFAKDYGVLIEDGPLAGITARALLAVDEGNKVVFSQLVPEIAEEPDYDGAMRALS